LKNNCVAIMAGEEVLRQSLVTATDGRPLARRVFFDDNSFELEASFLPLLKAHASYLREHPESVAVVSGHTQGQARQRHCWLLGERRSRAVVQALLAAGAQACQIAWISKGEYKPDVPQDPRSAKYRRRVNIEHVGPEDLGNKLVLPPGAPRGWKATLWSERASPKQARPWRMDGQSGKTKTP
jgi:peptidoglycan-associated lipoprotein